MTCRIALRRLFISSHVARQASEEMEDFLSRQAPRVQLESCAGVYAGRSLQGVMVRLGPSVGLYPAKALDKIQKEGTDVTSTGASGDGGGGQPQSSGGPTGDSSSSTGGIAGARKPKPGEEEPSDDVKAARLLATRRAAMGRHAQEEERKIMRRLEGMTGRQRKAAEAKAKEEIAAMRTRLAARAPQPNTQSSAGSLPGSRSFFVGENESIVAMELCVGAAVRCVRFLTNMGRSSPWFGSHSKGLQAFVLGNPASYYRSLDMLKQGLPPPPAVSSLQPWEKPERELCGFVGSSSSAVVTSLGIVTRRRCRQPVSPLANVFQECAVGTYRASHVAFRAYMREHQRKAASRQMQMIKEVRLEGGRSLAPQSRLGLELEPLVREVCSTADAVHAQFDSQVSSTGMQRLVKPAIFRTEEMQRQADAVHDLAE